MWLEQRANPRHCHNPAQVYVLNVGGVLPKKKKMWLVKSVRLHMKCDGARAETRFRLSTKWTSPLNRQGASVQSITGSRVVRTSSSNAGYTMF